MKLNTKIFNTPYSVVRADGPKQYPCVRDWVPDWVKFGFAHIKNDIKNKKPVTFLTLDVPTGTSKTMGMATFGEALPAMRTQLLVTHQTSIKDQHLHDFNNLIDQGFYTKDLMIENYQSLVSAIKKYESGKKISKKQEKIIDHLKHTNGVFFDETHRFSMSENVKSLTTILNFLVKFNLSWAVSVSATQNKNEGWYTLVCRIGNMTWEEAYEYRRYTMTRTKAAQKNYITLPEVVHVNTGLKLDIEIGEFKCQPWELIDKSEDQLRVMAQRVYEQTLKDNDPKNLKDKAKYQKVSSSKLYSKIRKFVEYRGRAALKIIFNPKQNGKINLVYMPRRDDADKFAKLYNKIAKKLKQDRECLVWHGESQSFHDNAGDSKVIQDRLQDPNDPLDTVILVGMWKEGVDIPLLTSVHDCGHTKDYERTKQVSGRLRNGGTYFAYIDVLNSTKLAQAQADLLIEQMGMTDDKNFSDEMKKVIADLQAGAASNTMDSSDENQQGEYKSADCYFDFDNPGSINLDSILGEHNITIVGWVKKVHPGQTTYINIPAEAFRDENANVVLSQPQKIEELFKAATYAKNQKVFS